MFTSRTRRSTTGAMPLSKGLERLAAILLGTPILALLLLTFWFAGIATIAMKPIAVGMNKLVDWLLLPKMRG